MLRFSANLGFLWPDLPLLDRIDAAAAAGFRGVELHWPYETPAADVRARCETHGLQLLGLNSARGDAGAGEFGLGALPGREAEFQAGLDQSIRYCVEAGATAIHCMAGLVAPENRAEARETFVANLRQASAKAAPHGLTLLLEPLNSFDVPGYFYSTSVEGTAIATQTGCANVRLMFDCYHAARSGEDVLAALECAFPSIGHVQIASAPERAEPGQGAPDYGALFRRLEALGYEGWIGCEYRPARSTDEGLRWAKALGVSLS